MKHIKAKNAALQTPCLILLCGLLGASAAFGTDVLRVAALPVLAFLILTGDEADDLLVYAALIPYAGLCEISGYNLLFACLLFSCGKLLAGPD